ncbi:hypothetical protein GCM10029978_042990 [Actinoallomurus acanthiterrae]
MVLAFPSSEAGVPERRAQPPASGPDTVQAPTTRAVTSVSSPVPARSPALPGPAAASRQATAASVTAAQIPASMRNSEDRTSEPVPSACTMAASQQAYAAQCSTFQLR